MSLALALLLAGQTAPADDPEPRLIAGFETLDGWRAQASDGVDAAIESVPGTTGRALRLEYDFNDVSGYAYARAALPVTFPENYELRLRVRGTPRVNDVQLKFVDASGDNVWWNQQVDFRPSEEWQTIRIRRRDMSFAWGPTEDKTLRETAAIELVVVRGRQGGAGFLEIDDLELVPLPANPPELPEPRASDRAAIDGDMATGARIAPARPLTIDFGGEKELGGVQIAWRSAAPRYRVEGADARGEWRLLREVRQGDGSDALAFGATEVTRLRVTPLDSPAELAEITIRTPEWGSTPTAMVSALAEDAPRGTFPRGFTEQSYWTLVGPDAGPESGLIGEDGAVEVARGGFSIEPFVTMDGRQYGWAEVTSEQSLLDGYLPIPSVTWSAPGFALRTTLVATTGDTPRLIARYRLTNLAQQPQTLRLALAIRPYQVNPAAQFLSQKGGVAPISRIVADENSLFVTSPAEIEGDAPIVRAVTPGVAPDRVVRGPFDSTAFQDWTPLVGSPAEDAGALASAALLYDVALGADESVEIPLEIPLTPGAQPQRLSPAHAEAAQAEAAAYWRERLNAVTIDLPEAYAAIPDTLRTATAHMLMSRNGPMLKPGTRSYNRSWIRDGAMISDGLLRLGIVEPVVDYADWYASYLFDSGKVPCCVDYRGADPVPENDSHGEFIHLLTQLYRFTGDRERLEAQWPKLWDALSYMEQLRQSERTEANLTQDQGIRYGLMPPSISHEGYSAKAQYSLWDDFWALTGYKGAAYAARILDKPQADEIAAWRDQFRGDIHAAIAGAVKHWNIDFIPGATSLGDFDATSTTMALDPAGEKPRLDPELLANTFERQWQRVSAREDGSLAWEDYTPYELRNVSAFVRLGWRDRAMQLLDWYFEDRRPAAWNGWAEVVGRDPREIRFIGDMPHAWVASDYVRAALDLFAYERHEDEALVLAAGLTPEMLSGDGAAIRGLRTPWGTLDYAIRADEDQLELEVGGGATPPGGYVFPWPFDGAPGRATIDGRAARFVADGLHIRAIGEPVRVTISRR